MLKNTVCDAIKGLVNAARVERTRFFDRDAVPSSPVFSCVDAYFPFALFVFLVPKDEEGKVIWVLWISLVYKVLSPGGQVLK